MEKQEEYRVAFVNNLKKLMRKHSVTQQELADAVGLKRQTIALYESGGASPRLEGFVAIAKHFDISCDYLLGITSIQSSDVTVKTVKDKYGLKEDSLGTLSKFTGVAEERISNDHPQKDIPEERLALEGLNLVLSDFACATSIFKFIRNFLLFKPKDVSFTCRVSKSKRDEDTEDTIDSDDIPFDNEDYINLQTMKLRSLFENLRDRVLRPTHFFFKNYDVDDDDYDDNIATIAAITAARPVIYKPFPLEETKSEMRSLDTDTIEDDVDNSCTEVLVPMFLEDKRSKNQPLK